MLEEEIKTVESSAEDKDSDLTDALLKMKENTVPRSEYEALKAREKKLLNAVVTGTPIEATSPERKSIDELRANFNKKGQTNLEYVTNMMALRDRLIEEGYQDPFLQAGHNATVGYNDIESANKVAEIYRHCIEKADGNSDVFTAELMRFCQSSIYDNMPQKRK